MDRDNLNSKTSDLSGYKNQNDLYRAFIEEASHGYFLSDGSERFIYVNQGFVNIFGCVDDNDVIGSQILDFIPEEKRQKYRDKLGEALSRHEKYLQVRTRIHRREGTIATVEMNLVFIYKSGVYHGIRGVVMDITHRVNVGKRLQEKQKRFSALFENANAAIFTMEEDVFSDCNQMTLAMFGCKNKDDIVGHFPWEYSPDIQLDGFNSVVVAKAKIQAALKGYPQFFYWKHCTKDRVLFDTEVSLNAIWVESKMVIQAIVRDISHRKRAEEALKQSEEKFRSLFVNTTIGFYRTTPEGEILMANPAAVEMLGCGSFEELKDRDLEREGFGPSYSHQQFKKQIESEGEIRGKEVVWRKMDGSNVFVRESARVVRDGEGNLLYYEGTVEDVTAHRNAENKLVESEKKLRQLNATKDKFFSIIAHDLKTPFNSIVGFSHLLLEDAEENNFQEVLKYAQIILNSSERAMGLLTNLLEWARSQTGRIDFNPVVFNLSLVVRDVLQLFADGVSRKNLSVKTKLPEEILVKADLAMIGTILRNLISNAMKFTQAQGVIEVSVLIEQDEVVVSVSDSGVGMNEESIKKLFKIEESFSTSGTDNEVGTGLGLILCHEFVQKHQGKIWVESDVGQGSTFSFCIPFINSKYL